MTTLKTITTIELSNDCQLACRYCINRDMERRAHRKRQIMSDEVFDATLGWIKKLCDSGTQKEVNMNGNGESFLDPSLLSRIRRVKEIVGPSRIVNMSTNGLIMSEDIAKAIRSSGLDSIQVSVHRAEAARRAGQILVLAGVKGSFNFGAIDAPHNWAGQLEKEYCVPVLPDIECVPLQEGRGYVSTEGAVSPCCYDYRLIGTYGSVLDADLDTRAIKPFELCRTCHQRLPEVVASEYGIKQPPRRRFGQCSSQPSTA